MIFLQPDGNHSIDFGGSIFYEWKSLITYTFSSICISKKLTNKTIDVHRAERLYEFITFHINVNLIFSNYVYYN